MLVDYIFMKAMYSIFHLFPFPAHFDCLQTNNIN